MLRWIVCRAAIFLVRSVAAGPIDETVFSAFEALCLDNMNEIGRVPSMADAIGMREQRDAAAKAFLEGHTGRVWIGRDKEARYLLILTDEGACSLTGPEANGTAVLNLILGNVRNRQLDTSKLGSSVQVIFAVTQPSRHGLEDIHAIVSVAMSNLQTVEGVQLSAMSEAMASAKGIHLPVWP
jgi:hypothetical protein